MFTEKDFLHCEGRFLVTEDGRKIVLKGTNLGGWLHREGWMDGAGACLLPAAYCEKKPFSGGIQFTFDRVMRINRVKLLEQAETTNSETAAAFYLEASLDGENWIRVGDGRLSDIRESRMDRFRPAPYAPGVNVYDEGCFIWDGMIHTNEFFAKYLRVYGITDGEPFRYGDVDDRHARSILEERFGTEKARELLQSYQNAYIQESDLRYVKSLGFNFLRIPIYWQEIVDEKGCEKHDAWNRLDWVIEKCRNLELYVMLDFHGAPGGNTMGSITAGELDSNDFWIKEEYQALAQLIWKKISARYQKEPTVACYDLINEPCASHVSYTGIDMEGVVPPKGPMLFFQLPERLTAPVRKFYQETVENIRRYKDRHILCVQQFLDTELVPFRKDWKDILYQVHCYPNGDFRDHDAVALSAECYLNVIRQIREKTEAPLLVGEFNLWEFEDVWDHWLETLTKLSVSWATWSYKITDPIRKDNWSLWYDFQGTYVDYQKDSFQTIQEKWSSFGTDNYKKNPFLEEILTKYAKAREGDLK